MEENYIKTEFTLQDFEEMCRWLEEHHHMDYKPWWDRIPLTPAMAKAIDEACKEYLER